MRTNNTEIVSINIDQFGDIDGLRFFKIIKKKPNTQKINKRRKKSNKWQK
jgi:ribosomal protein S12